nr:isoform 6 of ankyrin repeat and kh domain-containing protein 1 [Quercus suber]
MERVDCADIYSSRFRWAYCQLQELKTLPSLKPKYVEETLRSLPPTLDGTYERMLTGIKQMFRQEALVLLRWLAYAESPLSLEELAEAVIVDPTGGGRVELGERGALEDTLEILSGLVMVQEVDIADESSGELGSESEASVLSESEDNDRSNPYSQPWAGKDTKVRLAHFSVKEYLESRRILGGEAHSFYLESATEHRFLAQSCLTYLLFYSESSEKSSTKQDLITFPLLRYAARSWAYHSPLQRSGELVREMSLLRSEVAMSDWVLVYQPDQPWEKPFRFPFPLKTALYYASSLGLDEVVSQLLTTGSDVNARGGKYGNALQAASWQGHEKVVQMLLNAGAEMNAQGGEFCNALQAASWGGHEKVVRILLDAGAEINARGGLKGSALEAASWVGRVNVVQLLIDTGADVNVQGGEYGNALQAASSGGHEKIVQVLLDVGAAVNAQGGEHGTALQAASYGGYEKVVQMLLRAGAKANLQGGMRGNALQAASQRGHEKVVRMLLNAGADVNALGGICGNALQAAKGRKKVVQMLMEAGALDHVVRFHMKGSYSDEGVSWTGTQIFD